MHKIVIIYIKDHNHHVNHGLTQSAFPSHNCKQDCGGLVPVVQDNHKEQWKERRPGPIAIV